MLELIIFIIIILVVINNSKKKQTHNSASHPTPPVAAPTVPKKAPLSQTSVKKQVNQRIFGTSDTNDRVSVYNRLILTDRYTDMEKMAHELGISKYKVLREIQDLQKQGHYKNVTIDERNYWLIYPDAKKKERTAPKEEERTFIQPTKPYQAARNAGERYEEWTPVPAGKKVCRCGYCGADNLIPEKSNPSQYTCYFCREEL